MSSPILRRSYRVQFEGGTGFPLAGIVDRPTNDSGDIPNVPVVLFSHCFTCNKDLKAIVRISRQLADRGLAVLRYDMTGLGGSGGEFSETDFGTNVADLNAAARYASASIGSPAILLGHSLGGAASMAAASDWDSSLEPLQGIAMLAAPSDTQHLAELLVRMDGRVESEGQGEVTIGGRRWEIRRSLVENLRSYNLTDKISQLSLPLMIFHSPVDETVGYEHSLRIMSLASRSPTSLINLPGADHLLVNNNADIVYVADMVATWVQRVTLGY